MLLIIKLIKNSTNLGVGRLILEALSKNTSF